ncbi:MAG: DMT family transporter [Planctomycetes bacterium]|nr:DMT family transporter [Planctomycetota bacterium]
MNVHRLSVLAAGVLFATGGAALKLAPNLAPLDVAGLRSAIAALVIFWFVRESRVRPNLAVLGVAATYAATLMLFSVATRLTTAANAVFLQSAAPIWVILLGPVLLSERVRPRDALTLMVLAAGVTCFFVAGDSATATASDPALGNLLAATSSLTWAGTVLGLRALGRRGSNRGASAAAFGNLIAFAAAAPFFSAVGDARFADWLALIWLGVFQVGLAYVLLTRAVRHVPALDAALLLMIEPALNPLFAFAVHGERPAGLAILGGAIVVAGLLLNAGLGSRAARPNRSPG